MKTSVYIPDELWHKVQQKQPNASASQLLQDCLRARFEQTHRPSYATLSPALAEQRDQLHAKLQAKLVEGYQEGFELGLELVDGIPSFELFALLAREDFNLAEFKNYTDGDEFPLDADRSFDFLAWWEVAVEESGLREYLADWTQVPKVPMRGVMDALRGAWDVMSSDQDVNATPLTTSSDKRVPAQEPPEASGAAPE